MYVELIDALRCPRPHPSGERDSWLVAAARRSDGRCIVDGVLGCPVCRAQYPIAGGIADFGDRPVEGVAAHETSAEAVIPRASLSAAGMTAKEQERALRLAALLHLDTPGGIIAVGGTWDASLDALADLTDVRALVVEPAHRYVPREPFGAVVGKGLPVADGSLRGVALDEATATPARLDAAVRALRPGGRLVAPTGVALPEGVRELARDAEHWVAERTREVDTALSALVRLRRA